MITGGEEESIFIGEIERIENIEKVLEEMETPKQYRYVQIEEG